MQNNAVMITVKNLAITGTQLSNSSTLCNFPTLCNSGFTFSSLQSSGPKNLARLSGTEGLETDSQISKKIFDANKRISLTKYRRYETKKLHGSKKRLYKAQHNKVYQSHLRNNL